MDPVLKAIPYESRPSFIILDYKDLDDPKYAASAFYSFGLTINSDCGQALEYYYQFENNIFPEYKYESLDRVRFEESIASLDPKVTPYILVFKKDTLLPVNIEEGRFSGGVFFGYAWLADLRTLEVLGSIALDIHPGAIMFEESNTNMEAENAVQHAVKDSIKKNVKKIIVPWLAKFKGSNVTFLKVGD